MTDTELIVLDWRLWYWAGRRLPSKVERLTLGVYASGKQTKVVNMIIEHTHTGCLTKRNVAANPTLKRAVVKAEVLFFIILSTHKKKKIHPGAFTGLFHILKTTEKKHSIDMTFF